MWRLNRDRGLYVAALTAAVAGSASWFVADLGANDLWWQLAAGREFFALGAVPRVDSLSFTALGRPWTNHEWLWGVLSFALYRRDPQLLAWGNFALLAAIIGLTFELARRESGSALAAVPACWLAAASVYFFSDIRPHLSTLGFTALLLVTREHRRAPWLWPALMVVWSNLHAGYLFGLGALGLFVLTRSLLRQANPGSRLRWCSLIACALAIGINPWGYALLEYVLSYAPGAHRSFYADQINEWQPLNLELAEIDFFGPLRWLGSFRGRYVGLVVLAALGARAGWRRDPYLVLVGLTTVLMALAAQRFVALSAIVLAPLVAIALAQLGAAAARVLPARLAPRLGLVSQLVLLIGAAWLWTGTRLSPDLFWRWTQPDIAPQAAVHYLRALNTPLRVLNFETWGGYLALHAPNSRIFFDGRANTVYDETLYRDYLNMMNGRVPLAPLLAKYRPDAVLVPHIKIVDSLRALPQPWQVVYEDHVATLLLPPDSPLLARGLPDPGRVLAAEPQWMRREAGIAYRAGDRARALELLQRTLARAPLFLGPYTDLMAMLAGNGNTQAAEQVAHAAIVQLPERRRTLTKHLALAYEASGDSARAAATFRSAVVAGPFDSELELRSQIRRLEAARD